MLGPLTPTIRLTELLGEGAFGVVYKGHIEGIERIIAVKILNSTVANNQDLVRRFFNEAKATNRIRHTGIVQITEVGHASDGRLYLVMEFLEGETLSRRISRGPLPITTAIRFGSQLANALAYAHQQGVIHRDLKPDNIMIVSDIDVPGGERIKILDFGIARLSPISAVSAPDAKTHQQTAANIIMGTPSYMAPEQWNGARYTDKGTDVYALGVILYQLLSGRLPFEAPSTTELMMLHASTEPTDLRTLAPQVPPELAALVNRMLAKKNAERPTTDEVRRTLASRLALEPPPMDTQARRQVTAALGLASPAGPQSSPAGDLQPRTERQRASRLAAGLLLGAVVGVSATLVLRGPVAAPKTVSSGTVRIEIDTDPPGTAFEIREQETDARIGLTPISQLLPSDPNREYRWLAKKEGYKSVRFVVRPRSDLHIVLPIDPTPVPLTPSAPPKPEGDYDPFPK